MNSEIITALISFAVVAVGVVTLTVIGVIAEELEMRERGKKEED